MWSLSGRRTGKKSPKDKIKANWFSKKSFHITRASTPAPSTVHVVFLSHCHMVSLWTVSRNICLFVGFTQPSTAHLLCLAQLKWGINRGAVLIFMLPTVFIWQLMQHTSHRISPLSVPASLLCVVVQTGVYCCWLSVEFQLWSWSWWRHWLWSGKSASKMVMPWLSYLNKSCQM